VFPHPSDLIFIYRTPYRRPIRDIGLQSRPYFQEHCEILLYFGCRYSVSSLGIHFILGILVRLMDALHLK